MASWSVLNATQDFREHGVFKPVTITQDFACLTGLMTVTAALYFSLTRTRKTSFKDKVVLALGSAVVWYAGRYVLFGTRWAVTSTIWMTDSLWPVTPMSQWSPCPSEHSQCDFYSVPIAQTPPKLDKTGYAQAADLHFTPVLHYIKTFVEQEPLMLYMHLLCITLAGFLWPLQVWESFRQESYTRHKTIGKIVIASLLGSHVTAAVIAYRHILSNTWSEKVTGFGFAANITASMYTALAGLTAAIKRDIPTHKKNVIRMIGLAYGVFPTKYVWVIILSMSNMVSGEWVYPLSVCLSTVTGALVTEWALLGKLSGKDMAYDRHADKSSMKADAKVQ